MAAVIRHQNHNNPSIIMFIHFFLLAFTYFFISSYAWTEVEVLLKFKSSLQNNAAMAAWGNNNQPPCTENKANWEGVLCDRGTVLGLILEDKQLSGTIDVDTLAGLPNLRILSFQNNTLEGPFPDLKKLNALKAIYLSYNGFSGNIPKDAFAGMIWLKKLHLSRNKFTGPIPSSLATLPKLLELTLDGNQFSGQIPEFKQNSLQLDLSNNALEGPIPASLRKVNASMFSGNKGLCGQPLETCSTSSPTTPNSEPADTSKVSDEKPAASAGEKPADSAATKPSGGSTKPLTWIIMIAAIVGVFILLTIFVVLIINNRRNKQPPQSVEAPPSNLGLKACFGDEEQGSGSTHSRTGRKAETTTRLAFVRDDRGSFDLPDLLKASAEILGSGCFGSSYKTALPTGAEMVVKRFKQMNNVGKEDFQEHMRRLGRLTHSNLLPLVAYYYRKEEKLIVTDYVSKGSLAVLLHGHQSLGEPVLDWPTRLKIVNGVAKGLSYLYKELPSLITAHGHLKSSNVLLNESFEPLLSDYGLIPVINQESAQEFMVAYKSPEYVQQGRITKKTDVWALGMLILEILTGKFPATYLQKGKGSDEDEDLPGWVKSVVGEEMTSGTEVVFDKEMGGGDPEEMLKLLKIGLTCCEVDVEKRIDMKEAIGRIEELKEKDGQEDFYSLAASDDKRSSRGLSDDFVFN